MNIWRGEPLDARDSFPEDDPRLESAIVEVLGPAFPDAAADECNLVVTVFVLPLKIDISSLTAPACVGWKISFGTLIGIPLFASRKACCAFICKRCIIGWRNAHARTVSV